MRVAHLLRKYNSSEWGGTETAVKRLLDGLALHGAESVLFAPRLAEESTSDPFRDAGYPVRRFRAVVPVWGIKPEQKQQLISVGGNLFSFDLLGRLVREPKLSLIHTHALNRLGGIASAAARLRSIPLVVTVHGGILDLPATEKERLVEPLRGGFEWGKLLGLVVQSRRVAEKADAIVTCNRKEADLLRKKYPNQNIMVQPHGVPAALYRVDERAKASEAFPEIRGKTILLTVGRIDPVKNQVWLVRQMPSILENYPNALAVFVGACTDEAYGKLVRKEIRNLGLESQILLTGGLPQADPRLIGLYQSASAVLLPSLSETFGLTILEAWAAGAPVIASKTTGASELLTSGENGWLIDVDKPETFLAALNETLSNPNQARRFAEAGRQLAATEYDTGILAGRIKDLYDRLIAGQRKPGQLWTTRPRNA